jgi:hypothetical protein
MINVYSKVRGSDEITIVVDSVGYAKLRELVNSVAFGEPAKSSTDKDSEGEDVSLSITIVSLCEKDELKNKYQEENPGNYDSCFYFPAPWISGNDLMGLYGANMEAWDFING